jgi:hypothetical protein
MVDEVLRPQQLLRRKGSAIDARTTRHAGYRISQRKRKRIEECFGWLKTVAGLLQATAPWSLQSGLDLYLRLRGLQLGAHAQPGGHSSRGVSRGRGVSGGALNQAERPGKSEINSLEHHSR